MHLKMTVVYHLTIFVLIILSLSTAAIDLPNTNTTTNTTTKIKSLTFPLKKRSGSSLKVENNDIISDLKVHHYDDYYVDVMIGTPPTTHSLIIDTGSDITWVMCSSENICHCQKIFDSEKSETYETMDCRFGSCPVTDCEQCGNKNECRFWVTYKKGESMGEMAFDTFTMSQDNNVFELKDVPFGCAEDQEDNPVKYLDGLLGLDMGANSFYSFLIKLYDFTKFSYCLVDKLGESDASTLIFGEQASSQSTNVFYTPFENHDSLSHYAVHLMGISIDGEILEINDEEFPLPIILDSGSSITCFPKSVFDAVREKYRSLAVRFGWEIVVDTRIKHPYGLCAKIKENEFPNTPPMILHFKGENANLVLKPENIWHRYQIASCLAFEEADDTGTSYLGNTQQQGIRVIHDTGERRIGFVPSAC